MSGEGGPARWVIVGTGRIASRMAADLRTVPDIAEHVGTVSRSRASAEAFHARFDGALGVDSVDEAVDRLAPDIAYIASPHALHLAHAREFIDRGVAVLVEKPCTLSAEDTTALFDAAARADVYACEAMWTRFNPVVRALADAMAAEEIGPVTAVETTQGFRIPFDPADRTWAPDLGGGAARDLGCYGLSIALLALGNLAVVDAHATYAPNGLDDAGSVELASGAASGSLRWSLRDDIAGEARITGTDGHAVLEAPFQRTTQLILDGRRGRRSVREPLRGLGFPPMIEAVCADLRARRRSSEVVPPADSVAVAAALDDIMRRIGRGEDHIEEGGSDGSDHRG